MTVALTLLAVTYLLSAAAVLIMLRENRFLARECRQLLRSRVDIEWELFRSLAREMAMLRVMEQDAPPEVVRLIRHAAIQADPELRNSA